MDEPKAVPSAGPAGVPGRTRCSTSSRAAGVKAASSSRRTARRSGNAVETFVVGVIAPSIYPKPVRRILPILGRFNHTQYPVMADSNCHRGIRSLWQVWCGCVVCGVAQEQGMAPDGFNTTGRRVTQSRSPSSPEQCQFYKFMSPPGGACRKRRPNPAPSPCTLAALAPRGGPANGTGLGDSATLCQSGDSRPG